MKKILSLITALCAFQFAIADDVIYLKNGDEIKAIISEVLTNEVKYKKASNTSGPAYTISKADILMIIYSNGEKDIFQNQHSTPVQQNTTVYGQGGIIVNDGDSPATYNGKPISESQYMELARKNCPAAYTQYTKGKSLKTGGNVMLGFGVPLTAAGIACLAAGASIGVGNYTGAALYLSGTVFMCVGTPVMVAGIPLNCVGNSLKKRSFETYNNMASGTAQVSELQFKLMSNGIGIGMTF